MAVLREQLALVAALKAAVGGTWQDNGLVFPSRTGTVADAANVRRSFRKVTAAAGLNPADWTPRAAAQKKAVASSDEATTFALVGDTGIEPVTSSV